MTYSGAYAVILILHLLLAIFLVGPLAWVAALAPRWVADAKLEQLHVGLRVSRLYSLLSILVPLLGLALVGMHIGDSKPWSMSQGWVSASLTLYVIALLTTLVVLTPAIGKAIKALEAGAVVPDDDADGTPGVAPGGDDTRLALLRGRLQAAGVVQAACWVVIVTLMVFKPGA